MRTLSIDEVESTPEDVHADRRVLTGPLNTSNVAITRYVLDPGDRFSGSVHAHADQEEVFLVLEGEATFEIGATENDGPESDVTVGAGEAIRFAPGEFQSGRNDADDTVVAFALGAPRDSDDVRIARIPVLGDRNVECPDCSRDDMRIAHDGASDLVCPDCGAELDVE